MTKKTIDLSDIKDNDLDKTSSFVDLMTKKEKKNRYNETDDLEQMVNEKKKSTKDLTNDLKKAKEIVINKKDEKQDIEEGLAKTQILELTRQMKFNLQETKEKNIKSKKKGISPLNVIGEVNLLCIGYYTYLLAFTSYQDEQQNYMVNGGLIVLLVLLFGLSIITGKKSSKFFNILNILTIIVFLIFNTYTLLF